MSKTKTKQTKKPKKPVTVDEEIKGIIYEITNLVNDKIYIGKTKTHYGTLNTPYGIDKRLAAHIADAMRGDFKHGSPALCNAIRKHGKENFVIKEILRCDLEDINDNETEQIALHDSTNKKIGYNIALGGGGRSVVHVPEEVRKKISSKKGKNMNLAKVFRKGTHVGYTARRRDKGTAYQKWFSSTKNTPEENKELAEEWLENFRKNGIVGKTDYNKESKLPKNICKIKGKHNGKHIGYKVCIIRNGKKTSKTFQDREIPLPKLLKQAIKFKDKCLSEQT